MTQASEKLTYTFNKFFFDFIKEVKASCPSVKNDIKKKFKVVELKDTKYFDEFFATFEECMPLFVQNEDVFSNESITGKACLNNVTLKMVLDNPDVNENSKSVIKCYMLILTVLCFIRKESDNNDTLLETVLSCLKSIQSNENVEESLSTILDDDISSMLKHIQDCSSKVVLENEGNTSSVPNIDPSLLENTKIGNLAKEISEELDLSSFSNIQKPEDIMNLANIGSIVNKVGTKIQSKLANGELKQEDLVNEAFSFLNVLGGQNGASNLFNNPILKDVMKNFGSAMGGGANVKVNESKLRTMSARDRLRKKYEEKKGKDT